MLVFLTELKLPLRWIPLHGVLLGDPLVDTNTGLAPAAAGDTVPSTLQNDVEVHTIDTSGRVIPKATG